MYWRMCAQNLALISREENECKPHFLVDELVTDSILRGPEQPSSITGMLSCGFSNLVLKP